MQSVRTVTREIQECIKSIRPSQARHVAKFIVESRRQDQVGLANLLTAALIRAADEGREDVRAALRVAIEKATEKGAG